MDHSRILLKNGTVLQHDENDNVQVLRNTDILIVENRIAQVGLDLPADGLEKVIDCQQKIIAPGFINAHHHLWQTQLKGRFADGNMLDYILEGNFQAVNFTPDDTFWGQTGGCLESLDAGTTCVVDNMHMSVGPKHGSAALSATIASGIRAIFCYGVTPLRPKIWTESCFELDMDSPLPSWLFTQLEDLASRAPFGDDGMVQLGFFFDSYFLPKQVVVETIQKMRELGVKVISSHFRHWPVSNGQASIPELLDECSLLQPDMILSHGNGVTATQALLLTSAGVHIASTPDTEVFMAGGADPVAFRPDLPLTCLGADCHSSGPVGMLHQMQIALSSDRAAQTSAAFNLGQYPKTFRARIQDAFNLATVKAARAVRMGDQIGSIAVGKLADLVLFDSSTPTMACAAEQDPLVAVVRHAGVREVDTVIVGGRIRKQNGLLQPSDIAAGCREGQFSLAYAELQPGGLVNWKDVAKQLAASRNNIQRKIEGVNTEIARDRFAAFMGGLEDVLV